MCNCGFSENDYPNPFNQTTKKVDGYYLQITSEKAAEHGYFIQNIQTPPVDESNKFDVDFYRARGLIFAFTIHMQYAAFIKKEDYTDSFIELVKSYLYPLKFKAIAATSSEHI
jgi:hypothetical protein